MSIKVYGGVMNTRTLTCAELGGRLYTVRAALAKKFPDEFKDAKYQDPLAGELPPGSVGGDVLADLVADGPGQGWALIDKLHWLEPDEKKITQDDFRTMVEALALAVVVRAAAAGRDLAMGLATVVAARALRHWFTVFAGSAREACAELKNASDAAVFQLIARGQTIYENMLASPDLRTFYLANAQEGVDIDAALPKKEHAVI